jgi:hypothetical protein
MEWNTISDEEREVIELDGSFTLLVRKEKPYFRLYSFGTDPVATPGFPTVDDDGSHR